LLSTKFNELQELQARQEAATRQADSSSFELTRHLREEQSVTDFLCAHLSTLEHLKLKCLDEITSRTQPFDYYSIACAMLSHNPPLGILHNVI
jgi:hypothetical protein